MPEVLLVAVALVAVAVVLVAVVAVAVVLAAVVLVAVAVVPAAVVLVAVVLVAVVTVALVVELSLPPEVSPPLPPVELPSLVAVVSLPSAPPLLLLSFDELSPVVPPAPSLVGPPEVPDDVVVTAAVEMVVVLLGPVPDAACVVLEVVFVVSALLARSFPSLDMFSSTALAQLASATESEVPKISKFRRFTAVSRNTKLMTKLSRHDECVPGAAL